MKITRRQFLYFSGCAAAAGAIGSLSLPPRYATSRRTSLSGVPEDAHARIRLTPYDMEAGQLNNLAVVDGELRLVRSAGGTCVSPVISAPIYFNSLGTYWQNNGGDGAVAIRVSADGSIWSEWRPIASELGQRDDRGDVTFGALQTGFSVPFARFVQFTLTLTATSEGGSAGLKWLTLSFINSTQGPTTRSASTAQQAADVTSSPSRPSIISRAAWGCPDGQTSPNWPAEYQTVTHIFVHHTATSNVATDWAAVVRAIWYYHSIDLDWGDIGYHFLVDPDGYLYEGRSGGDDVIGGHVYGFNRGSVGLAFLGTYSYATPGASMVSAAEALLAWKAGQRGINVTTSGSFVSYPTCSSEAVAIPRLLGHRDAPGHGAVYDACNVYGPTACPGDELWSLLPRMRLDVAGWPSVMLNPVSTAKTWFGLTWTSTGTGSLTYTVQTSSNGSTWTNWLVTSRRSALFVGAPNKTYYFRAIVADSGGRTGTSAQIVVHTGTDGSGLSSESLRKVRKRF